MTTLPTGYVSLMRGFQRRASEIRQPVNGTFELTERCNLSCGMCYVRQPSGDAAVRARELSAAQWVALSREAVDAGLVFLLLTGGEVLLRPDFFDIYLPLTRLGLMLTLFTNGTLVTDDIARRLAEAPPSLTQITLYGATAETCRRVTGVAAAYDRCRAGIEALLRHDVPLQLTSTITRHNIGELPAMRQMALDWGLPFAPSWMLMRRRDGAPSDVLQCRLTPCDSAALEAAERPGVGTTPRDDSGAITFRCEAGRSAFAVDSAGRMNLCLNLAWPAASIPDSGFRAAWDTLQRFVDEGPPLDPACVACDHRGTCPRCPAWSACETGTLTGAVPYLCEYAAARRALADLHP